MSKWEELGLEEKIVRILLDDPLPYAPDPSLGRPYMTPYQLAIALTERYPETSRAIGLPIGGEGIGQRNSLAQYIAGTLSRGIRAGKITRIEGGYLSSTYVKDFLFASDGETHRSSLTSAGFALALFRAKWE